MKPNPIIEGVATLMIMAMLMVAGYMWLVHETERIIQHKEQRQQSEQKHEKRAAEKSAMEKLAPKSFERLVKTTEME